MSRVIYRSLSAPMDYVSNNYVPETMAMEQEKLFSRVLAEINQSPIDWLSKKLDLFKTENLLNMLSYEQIDAVILAIYQIENGKVPEFIIADTMGNGKGRILASIARYGMANNKKILFFTLTTNLFSAFWSDLEEVGAINYLKNNQVFLMHSSAKIYNRSGELIQKSFSHKDLSDLIKGKTFTLQKKNKKTDAYSNLIFTTYSQFSSAASLKDKISFLSRYVDKDTIILFDEFHKSIGDSTTKQAKDELMKFGASVIRSSATFLSQTQQLDSYLELVKLNKDRDRLAIKEFEKHIDLNLNAYIAHQITQSGMMIRRENKEVSNVDYVDITIEEKETIRQWLGYLSAFFYSVFQCYREVQSGENIQLPDNLAEKIKPKWTMFGSMIVRLSNMLNLLGKKTSLIHQIECALDNNEKVVVTLESTYQSSINQIIELQESVSDNQSIKKNNEYKKLNFSSFLESLFYNVFADIIAFGVYDAKFDGTIQNVLQSIQSFPDIPLSFIDDITEYFEKKGECVVEISGRDFKISRKQNKSGENIYTLHKKESVDKALIEQWFNNGVQEKSGVNPVNICFLTLSGSTGISLHSSRAFKDQRKRVMIEAQITNKAIDREQFFGRHNRRNQVVEPRTLSLSSGTGIDKRNIMIGQMKADSMQAFNGGSTEIVENNFYNETFNDIALQFLLESESAAKSIGVFIQNETDVNRENNYYIDLLSKRFILMPNRKIDEFENLLDKAFIGYNLYCRSINNVRKQLIQNLKFNKVEKIWQYPNIGEVEVHKYESFNTLKPVVLTTNGISEVQLEANDIGNLQQELTKNQSQFDVVTYQKNISSIFINPFIYRHLDLAKTNHKKMLDIKIGQQIVCYLDGHKIYGYLNNILMSHDSIKRYPINYIYEIVLINPNSLADGNRISLDKIHIPLSSLLVNPILVSDKSIDWEKYKRNNEMVISQGQLMIGNAFYLNVFKHVYSVGESVSFIKQMPNQEYPTFVYAIRLPNNYDVSHCFKSKELIISPLQAMSCIRQYHCIESDSGHVKILLDKKTGRYFVYLRMDYYLVNGNFVNYFSYPMFKLLSKPVINNGFAIFSIEYKDLSKFLFNLIYQIDTYLFAKH